MAAQVVADEGAIGLKPLYLSLSDEPLKLFSELYLNQAAAVGLPDLFCEHPGNRTIKTACMLEPG